ncbi:DUF47 family protein [Brevibacterium gallinarum]|uniref:DUF47 family protein n=1 Tax=Brevibacterium gallinarum TaxID=2762220 RepID=A0ABR8WV59_9MICO|nr:DUF47 family protein [Brevibacterium gallinarum]MBD8020965.1 DUF47 family protein [Brevibacterium gallinarum]NUL60015.1 DUF47 family protein [Brevibacterium luteolum]
MRLRRTPQDTQLFARCTELAELIQGCNLVLAELSGIPADARQQAGARMEELTDQADAALGSITRQLRENYITPLDRGDIFALADRLREVCYQLESISFAMTSQVFDELPAGVLEMLAVLSNQSDQTLRMTRRLQGHYDQWDYVETMDRLHLRAISLSQSIADAVPLSRRGLTYTAASMQLAFAFTQASASFKDIGRIAAAIALKES